MECYLVLIETSGNQNYIFSTNLLRENVGASELTWRVGTEWTLTAINQVCQGLLPLWPKSAKSEDLRRNLLDTTINREIESLDDVMVEVIMATSGKAMLLTRSYEVGRMIISAITERALVEAPGIDVCGVISSPFNWANNDLDNSIREVHRLFEETRLRLPNQTLRYQRLPFIAECASSGLPAREYHTPEEKDGMEPAPRSAVTLAKWAFRKRYEDRMKKLLPLDHGLNFSKNIEELDQMIKEKMTRWIAIIHADGNGLGQIFLDFKKHSEPANNREYVVNLRNCSLGLDLCTERAFLGAIEDLIKDDRDLWFKLPLIPILLGGDDMTVVCDGLVAIPFTNRFLQRFEEETGRTSDLSNEDRPLYEVLQRVAASALGAPRLSSCAGISIVKPHFPFSIAYSIAESLLKSAKEVKNIFKQPTKEGPWPVSAIDFHINYDSSATKLDEIRDRMISPDQEARLHCRPYVVSDTNRLRAEIGAWPEQKELAFKWLHQHDWRELEVKIDAISANESDDQRSIPKSQIYELRAGLHISRTTADARYKLIRHRYLDPDKQGIEALDGAEPGTIFEPIIEKEDKKLSSAADKRPRAPQYLTKLLDAIEIVALSRTVFKSKGPVGDLPNSQEEERTNGE